MQRFSIGKTCHNNVIFFFKTVLPLIPLAELGMVIGREGDDGAKD